MLVRFGSAGFTVGFNDLKGYFPSKWFCDIIESIASTPVSPSPPKYKKDIDNLKWFQWRDDQVGQGTGISEEKLLSLDRTSEEPNRSLPVPTKTLWREESQVINGGAR